MQFLSAPKSDKSKKRKSLDLLSDDEFVCQKKEKMSLEIQQLQECISFQRERSKLELNLLSAQISELESRKAVFDALLPVITNDSTCVLKLFKILEPWNEFLCQFLRFVNFKHYFEGIYISWWFVVLKKSNFVSVQRLD